MTQQLHYWEFPQRTHKYIFKGVHALQCLKQYYLQQPNYGKSPNVHQLMNGLRRCTHTGILLGNEKE